MMIGWTIYDHPKDFPKEYVARKWTTPGGEVVPSVEDFYSDTSLERVRDFVKDAIRRMGQSPIRFTRNESDDPVIMETWI